MSGMTHQTESVSKMIQKPLAMGAEVEYSMSAGNRGVSTRKNRLHGRMLDAIAGRHRWLPDLHSPYGIYLDNGSRYYLDSGYHNEFCTPEVETPRQIAIYDRAAERILLDVKAALMADPNPVDVSITKHNVNFTLPDQVSWGQHEAYTCWVSLEQAAAELIPHLVSRIPYAGAGCLSADPAGVGFELSQRARHMKRTLGRETMHDRAIFCTRGKSSDQSTAGWTRTNLICKDSQRCSFGMYLSFGVTGLLMMIVNRGHRLGRKMQLCDPVAAMQCFSRDPSLRVAVPLVNGGRASALQIQRYYLEAARPHVESGDYPEWTVEVFSHWSQTLDALEADPNRLARRLDPFLKRQLFQHQLDREGIGWQEFHRSLQQLDRLRRIADEPVVAAFLKQDPRQLDSDRQQALKVLASDPQANRCSLERLRFVVRMQAIELNFHELGGLFDQLDAQGFVDHVVIEPADVERAMHAPPPGRRAEARGKIIERYHGQTWACSWDTAVHMQDGSHIDLSDPFSPEWKAEKPDSKPASRPSAIESLLSRIPF